MEIKNVYVIAIVLALLFGIGVGYQLNTWFAKKADTTACANQNTNTNSTASPLADSQIFVRTGKVTKVTSDSISFQAYVQNTGSGYALTTLTASVTSETTFTQVNTNKPSTDRTTIALSDIKEGDQVAIQADENIYGKTSFTASSVQKQVTQ